MADTTHEPGPEFDVTSSCERGMGLITLSGYIASNAEAAILKAYDTVTQQGAKEIRFHCASGIVLTSSGIAVLISTVAKARKRSQRIVASGLSAHYKKIFSMIGLSEYVVINDDTAEKH